MRGFGRGIHALLAPAASCNAEYDSQTSPDCHSLECAPPDSMPNIVDSDLAHSRERERSSHPRLLVEPDKRVGPQGGTVQHELVSVYICHENTPALHVVSCGSEFFRFGVSGDIIGRRAASTEAEGSSAERNGMSHG